LAHLIGPDHRSFSEAGWYAGKHHYLAFVGGPSFTYNKSKFEYTGKQLGLLKMYIANEIKPKY